jgi:hypothetical protein
VKQRTVCAILDGVLGNLTNIGEVAVKLASDPGAVKLDNKGVKGALDNAVAHAKLAMESLNSNKAC